MVWRLLLIMKTTAQTNKDLITKLDKEVALIKKDIEIIKSNHLFHIEKSIRQINYVLWTVGIMIFSNLLIMIRGMIG